MDRDTRPVNPDLTRFAFPITALASTAHRIVAVGLRVGIAFLPISLDKSLWSEAGFIELRECVSRRFASDTRNGTY
ncbi:MAG: hypothetical protein QGD92_11530 [Gammaproteobacteria bacterium]|nr:hypothetical protein [Gammaproteobacteria bacterium]